MSFAVIWHDISMKRFMITVDLFMMDAGLRWMVAAVLKITKNVSISFQKLVSIVLLQHHVFPYFHKKLLPIIYRESLPSRKIPIPFIICAELYA